VKLERVLRRFAHFLRTIWNILPGSVAEGQEQIPFGNDRQKTKGNGKSNGWLGFVVSHPSRKN
jgi:hypothetical protein